MSDEIKALTNKRKIFKANLTRFETFLNGIDATSDTVEKEILKSLELRMKQIVPLLDEFVLITCELTCDQEEQADAHDAELGSFQEKYFRLVAKAELIIEKNNVNSESNEVESVHSNKSDNSQTTNANNTRTTTVKLPTINLPNFDGTFTKWREFQDKFDSLIESNNYLSNTQKLTYLKSALKGEPSELLASLSTTDANYKIAWDRLEKRYNNKRRIINNHVNELLHIPTINRESHLSLRSLITTAQNQIDCLRTLDVPVDKWNAILIPILTQKLDSQTSKEWESKLNNKINSNDNIPTFDEFIEFLNVKQNTLETFSVRNKHETTFKSNSRETKSFNATNESATCLHCKKSHFLINCDEFQKLDENERNKRVRELKLCINCLRKGHFLQNCQSKSTCKKCKRRHHTLIHLNAPMENNQGNNDDNTNTPTIVATHTSNHGITNALLSTAKVIAYGNHEVPQTTIRALLDQGSQSNFVTHATCETLNLKLVPINVNVKGIMNTVNSSVTHHTTLTIKSCCNNYTAKIDCLVVKQITSDLPTCSFEQSEIPVNIKLADPTFNVAGKIDILIGVGLFYELLCVGQIKRNNKVIFQKTRLGWIASGNLYDTNNITSHSGLLLNDLHNQVEKFWETEELQDEKRKLSLEEKYCEQFYNDTTTRDLATGKFIVRLPLKQNLINQLGDSKPIAKQRLTSIESRFSKNISLCKDYTSFMREYLNSRHMSKISTVPENSFYLPHHAVVKPESETTKTRVVFDGSCKLDRGLSINEIQCVGPTIQQELTSIVARFRTHKYVMTADITKMYRQIMLNENDRKYQSIYWRFNVTDDIESYQLNTVTYGTSAAPFLAIRSLFQLAIDNESIYPTESRVIKEDFYVDDLLTGHNSIYDLMKLKTNISNILNSAGFNLTKWASNAKEMTTENMQNKIEITEKLHKTLGIFWNPEQDMFCYSTKGIKFHKQITKRTILATTAQLFDPLGLLSPAIMHVKILLQNIWQLKIDWDETLTYDLQTKWLAFQDKIHFFNNLNIPRHIITESSTRIEIHTFSDASERGYGACMYVRSSNETQINSYLLASKSRVAPMKYVSMPRLELCAALLAGRLFKKYKDILNLEISKYYFWSDSQIVIAWINSQANRFNTYVANRVTEIQEICNTDDWYYVSSKENPADLISRGMLPNELINSTLWWHGPSWLNTNFSNDKFQNETFTSYENIPEIKKQYITLNTRIDPKIININNFSSLSKLIRIMAYVLRFGKYSNKAIKGQLTTKELNEARILLIKLVQQECFPAELNSLIANQTLDNKSNLLSLTPFLDSDGVIRVGGRLQLSDFSYDKKHPIILPKSHHFTNLLFKREHLNFLHAGPNLLLSNIRETYWPISGKNTAKKIVRECIRCTRYKAESVKQLMGSLPRERTVMMYPFHSVGCDFAGPFLIKDHKRKGSKFSKAYLCLFICFSTKALHLELITELTTNAFISTLRRFIARRGKPQNIFSDNGTTFVGAQREISTLYEFLKTNSDEIATSSANIGIQWHFIPAYAPNFGGLWEINVKCVKYHLKRVLGDNKLTYEDFQIVLSQIESILNSRPLFPLTSNPNDIQALSPAHFLIGRTFEAMADPDVTDIQATRLDRFQYLQQLSQGFWKQWSKAYISELQQRSKWRKPTSTLNIVSMILVKHDNQPPAQWLLGRVVDVHKGNDDNDLL